MSWRHGTDLPERVWSAKTLTEPIKRIPACAFYRAHVMLSTGQAARLCSVTPNAVLKWIRGGKLPARRTPGGHFRVDPEDLERFVATTRPGPRSVITPAPESPPFRYCWEHNGRGRLPAGCGQCVVYQMRAQRCYEVIRLAPESGHSRLFCTKSCDQCDYFRTVHLQATNVLVVTDDQILASGLREASSSASFSLRTTHCEYACSAVVQSFRPDFAIIDCALGPERSRDILSHLLEDPRIPFVRVVLAAEANELPHDCDHRVFATIRKPLGIDGITALIRGACDGAAPTGRTFEAANGTEVKSHG